jgi:RimJ/RimL family protein N-acetyltransferase
VFPRTLTTRDQRPLVIREAVGDDAPALLEFLEIIAADTTYISFEPGEFSMTEEQEREFLDDARRAVNHLYLVAVVGGTIAGCLTFGGGKYRRTRHTGFFGVSVRREFWSQGIGTTLLDGLLDWARDGGIVRKIDLYVRTDNHRAIALYERKGFVREGTKRMDLIVDGHAHESHLMGLVL